MAFDFAGLVMPGETGETKRSGETIFAMGERGSVLYVLKSGEAQIKVGDLVFETVSSGDIVGEMSLLDGEEAVRSASVVALTDCQIVPVGRQRLMELVSANPAVALELSKVVVRRLRATNYLAHHDPVTGLANRFGFQERCRTAILRGQRRGSTVTVLLIDLDHFKSINDSLGYAAGDAVLRQVAQRIGARVHELDEVARLAADEFVVLLEDASGSHDTAALAEALLQDLAKPYEIASQSVYLSASAGVTCYPQDGDEPQALIAGAHSAMSEAKTQGGNGYRFYSSELHRLAVEALSLRNHLRLALEKGEFLLNFQPRVAIPSGRIIAVEALLRWKHPQLGLVPPGKFIPVAEQTGMIDAIGEWVLRATCLQHRAWVVAGVAPLRVAVNLSTRQLRQADLPARIKAILRETGMDPSMLELEITESAVMEEPARTVHLLKAIRDMGVAIALDDFGTEYSSLGYLTQFPLDYMKIDQSFLRGVPGAQDNVAIIRAIITLAKNLKLDIIAEGVETREQLQFVTEQGCEEYQGFFFSRPVPADELEALFRGNIAARAA